MKLTLTFKTPDVLGRWQEKAIERYVDGGLDELGDDYDQAIDEIAAVAKEVEDRFVEYGEYISIEFDTEAKTATVLSRK